MFVTVIILSILFFSIVHVNSICWLYMPLYYICIPENVNLSPKHVGQFICMDDVRFHTKCAHLLLNRDNCIHNAPKK